MRWQSSAGRSWMGPRFRIEFSACFLIALGLLILPLDWLFGAILAAVFHELCHYMTAKMLGISCLGIRIQAGGMVMELPPVSRTEELVIAAAGPVGSFFLLCFVHLYPQLAVCGAVQGTFNLLPIWPLDGGRILRCLFSNPRLCEFIERSAAVGILCVGIWLGYHYKLGLSPVFLAALVTVRAFLRKIPCNAAQLGVQ